MTTPKPIKLFSRAAIVLATFVGSLACGLWLMGLNEKRLHKPVQARVYFWSAVLFCASFFAFLVWVPENIQTAIPTSVFVAGQLGILYGLFNALQKKRLATEVAEGRARYAGLWQGLLCGILSMALILSLLVGAAYFGAFPPFAGEHFRFGAFAHEVYYENVSEAEAQELAVALDELGHFDFFDFSIYFQINRVDGRLQLTFPYEDQKILTSKEVQDYFKNLKESLARDYHKDVDIILFYDGLTDSAFQKI